MSQQLLDAPNIIPVFEQMRSKTMPKGVTTGRFRNFRRADCIPNCILQISLAYMVPAFLSTAWIHGDSLRRKNILPSPFARGLGILAMQGCGQINCAAAANKILSMQLFDSSKMCLNRTYQPLGKNGDSFAQAFSFSNHDLPVAKIDVLDSQTKTFEQA